jgi:hypothetical protein
MLSQAIKTKLVFALLLAMVVAWGGHAAAWLANSSHPVFESADSQHPHVHDADEQPETSCTLCLLQHEHLPHGGDHLHETPYPIALIKVHPLAERSDPLIATRIFLPDGPVFLIERPPRPSVLL